MLMEKKTYHWAGFNFRLAILISTLAAFFSFWAYATLALPEKTPLGSFLQVEAVRLERLPIVPATRPWFQRRLYLYQTYPRYLAELDTTMDRAIVAAGAGGVAVPLLWAFIRFRLRHKKHRDETRPRRLADLIEK